LHYHLCGAAPTLVAVPVLDVVDNETVLRDHLGKDDFENSEIQFPFLQVSKQLLEPGQFVAALCEILSHVEDLLVDIPKFWNFIAQVIARNK
jgi:hypothetical protein